METRVLYQERMGWPWWVHPLIGLTLLAAVFPIIELLNGNVGGGEGAMPPWVAVSCLALGLGIPATLYSFMGELRTRVTSEGIEVSWGYLGVIRKFVPLWEVTDAEAVTYSPLGEFGGWGIRFGGNRKRAWTVRGNRAVLLHLRDGTRFYLGSDNPERVLQWVQSGMRRGMDE